MPDVPQHVPIEQCRSCGAAIWWAKTKNGKSCPYDVIDGVATDTSHFSTCRDARQWTRRPVRKEG